MPYSSICQNAENHNKASRGLKKIANKCLKQKHFKQYLLIDEEGYNFNASHLEEQSMISFSFGFPTDQRIVHEEILIFDQIGLLADLGGSLGLFLGFSLYGYITTFFDVLLNQLVRCCCK